MSNDALNLIVANGAFPQADGVLDLLRQASRLIACDGAAEQLLSHGFEPTVIVGDLDSVSEEVKRKYADRLVKIAEQETNDLTKAFNYALNRNWRPSAIVGASGKREDQLLGNLGVLAQLARTVPELALYTDYGVFRVLTKTGKMACRQGQQISIFALDAEQEITSVNLKYPLQKLQLPYWSCGTLNQAEADWFGLTLSKPSPVVVFLANECK